jgi:uncharacterized SAM-binding protein YcdF (DUF218 family)
VFFILSKTIGTAIVLPNLLVLVGLLGVLLLLTRHKTMGRWLVVSAFLALVVCGVSPLGTLLLQPLENRFPAWTPTEASPTGIVVLGGGIKPDISAARGTPVAGNDIDRVIAAATLARKYPQARIIYSGGTASLNGEGAREADFAVQLFSDLGVSPGRVEVERNSRNTEENAIFSKQVAAPKPGERWLLVTSAFHMPRSVGLFRHAGFPIEPVPVGWFTTGSNIEFGFDNFASGIYLVNIASREWIGLIAYRLAGKTDAVFPSPWSSTMPSRSSSGFLG